MTSSHSECPVKLYCYNYMFDKVTKEAVDNSHPDTTIPFLKFKATLKAEQKVSDLKFPFKGMRFHSQMYN